MSCSQIRESAGVNRKNIDEFRVVENPPLVIPPDFDLLAPEQLSAKNIDNAENDLAKEILFGLSDEIDQKDTNTSTIKSIISKTNANKIDDNIRQEIDENFAFEKQTESKKWNDEVEILDSIAESERLRNERLGIDADENKIAPTKKIKNKKKKRFFFF
tara:strand:+ start:290 stop:766 length:477 start_codon:yes stop_codon:yes gene_type:complete